MAGSREFEVELFTVNSKVSKGILEFLLITTFRAHFYLHFESKNFKIGSFLRKKQVNLAIEREYCDFFGKRALDDFKLVFLHVLIRFRKNGVVHRDQ